jgi:hypothetical protein
VKPDVLAGLFAEKSIFCRSIMWIAHSQQIRKSAEHLGLGGG